MFFEHIKFALNNTYFKCVIFLCLVTSYLSGGHSKIFKCGTLSFVESQRTGKFQNFYHIGLVSYTFDQGMGHQLPGGGGHGLGGKGGKWIYGH